MRWRGRYHRQPARPDVASEPPRGRKPCLDIRENGFRCCPGCLSYLHWVSRRRRCLPRVAVRRLRYKPLSEFRDVARWLPQTVRRRAYKREVILIRTPVLVRWQLLSDVDDERVGHYRQHFYREEGPQLDVDPARTHTRCERFLTLRIFGL